MALSLRLLPSLATSLLCVALAACSSPDFDPDATQTVDRTSGASVVVYDFGDLTLHNYNDAAANGLGSSTYIIESENNLVLIDSQFFPDSATDFRAYADGLDKPIDRVLITHGHQDHVRGLAAAFTDVTSYSSPGVIAEALADSGSVINEAIGTSATIDGVDYTFDVRQNLEAEEQVIITLPDQGILSLGDLFYNDHHAVMNPGFDGWINALDDLGAADMHLFLAGHGPAGTAADVAESKGYLETARATFASAADGPEFTTTMTSAYPNHAGAFLLQLSVDEILYPQP